MFLGLEFSHIIHFLKPVVVHSTYINQLTSWSMQFKLLFLSYRSFSSKLSSLLLSPPIFFHLHTSKRHHSFTDSKKKKLGQITWSDLIISRTEFHWTILHWAQQQPWTKRDCSCREEPSPPAQLPYLLSSPLHDLNPQQAGWQITNNWPPLTSSPGCSHRILTVCSTYSFPACITSKALFFCSWSSSNLYALSTANKKQQR